MLRHAGKVGNDKTQSVRGPAWSILSTVLDYMWSTEACRDGRRIGLAALPGAVMIGCTERAGVVAFEDAPLLQLLTESGVNDGASGRGSEFRDQGANVEPLLCLRFPALNLTIQH